MLQRFLGLILISVSLLWSASYPQDLASHFQDKDHDLIADTPTDPQKWIDPPVLRFSYAPHDDPDLYAKIWKDFITYLSKKTGKRVVYFPYRTNTAQLEAMRYGKLHISGFNTGLVPTAVHYAGFVPVAMMTDAKGAYGYRMLFITKAKGGIKKIEEIKGKTIAFTTPSSNSGCKAARFILSSRFHLQPKSDYRVTFAGSHAKAIKGVVKGKYPLAAVASSVLQRMITLGEIDPGAVRILYRSERFPTTAYGYLYNLKPTLAQKIKDAFFTFPWYKQDTKEKSSLKKAFKEQEKFSPINYQKMWQHIREIEAYDRAFLGR